MGCPSSVEIARILGRAQPTPEQIAVIEAPLAPVLVVAGAGSGKTETMASRVVWLVAGGKILPDEVLGLTFTRKAAGELAERIRGRLKALQRSGIWVPPQSEAPAPTTAGEVTVSTYHAYAGRLVREYGLRLGLEPNSRLLTEAAAWQLASTIVERWAGPMDAVEAAGSTVTSAVLGLAGEAAEHLVDLADLEEYLADRINLLATLPYNEKGGDRQYKEVTELLTKFRARRQILPIVRAYQQAKRDRDCLDFGDQLAFAARLTQTVPGLRLAERAQFKTVLLDEFQDTSYAQLVMLRQVFGQGHSVTAVGDPHQSIYGWRGASADTLTAFTHNFPTKEATPAPVCHLSTSWRNDRVILAAANATAAPLSQHTGVKVRSAQPRPDAGLGQVRVLTCETSEAEAEAVVDWLAEQWLTAAGQPIPGKTAAILCRRRAQFTDLEPALIRRGLPYQIVGLGGLLSTPEVADLLAALQVIQDPSRGDALMRLLTGPACRLGPHDLIVLGGWSRELHRRRVDPQSPQSMPEAADLGSLVEALDELPPANWTDRDGRELSSAARGRLARLADTFTDLGGRTSLALPELVVEVERALLLDVELASRVGVSPAQARAQLDAFAKVAADFAASADYPTLGSFLSWVAAAQTKERGLEPGQVEVVGEVIQVMTVHAAKGLEWDLVAVPGLVEGSFPQHNNRPKESPEGGWQTPVVTDKGWLTNLGAVPYALRGDRLALPEVQWSVEHQKELKEELALFEQAAGEHQLAEERRLAYVAWTRARHHLLLSGHIWGSTKTPKLISRFVLELAPGLLETSLAGATTGLELGPVASMPEAGQERPGGSQPIEVAWPTDPLGVRRPAVEAAAALVRAALGVGAPTSPSIPDELDELVDVLLAERDQGRSPQPSVQLPTHLSASRLVQLATDPQELALALRRPVPREPAPAARRGTAFHAWVEQQLGGSSLLEIHELPGAADEDPAEDALLAELIANFQASEWASRTVLAVEVPLETPIDGTVIRGRVDAVFARPDGGVDIVDWKTGAVPTGERAQALQVQLAAYRLAWHRLHRVPLAQIGAAFCYVRDGVTVRPADLMGEAELTALLRGAG